MIWLHSLLVNLVNVCSVTLEFRIREVVHSDVAMATNFRVKWAKSADSPSFIALAFLNRVECRNFNLNRFICDDWVRCVKISSEYQKGRSVYTSSSISSLATRRYC